MNDLKNNLYRATEAILTKLLDFRKSHPDFTFALRERDSAQSDEVRLASGQWFQGSNYIYVPLFGKGDTARKIKTLGFVLTFEEDGEISENYVEISFKGGINDQREIAFHNELAARLNINLNNGRFGSFYYEDPEKYLTNLDDYINRVRSIALELLEKNNIRSMYVIPEDTFAKRLAKINEVKLALSNKSSSTPGGKLFEGPLNQILYGPPGTGKTYYSIDEAVKICQGTSSDHDANKRVFDDLRKEGYIEFVTFHQNYSYEDFIVGIKPDTDDPTLRFSPYKGIFYRICKKARENYEAARAGTKVKPYEEIVDDLLSQITEDQPLELKTVKGKPFWLTGSSETTIFLKKSTGNESHTLSISTLIDIAEGKKKLVSGLNVYYNPLIDHLNKSRSAFGTREEIKNYVLVIDEINRANISKVFGELITLLEDDKRLGGENELRVTLPNNETDFAVPPNLYLVGTMNTADKSIALIDIALRRRFEFIGKYPDYNMLKSRAPEAAILLESINRAIYKKKNSADFLIGHAYFLKSGSIDAILKNKVLPLLMEYFSSKTDIVSEIFKGSGWNVEYDLNTFSWKITRETK